MNATVTYDPDTGIVRVRLADGGFTGTVPDAIKAFTRFAENVTNPDTITATHDLLTELRKI